MVSSVSAEKKSLLPRERVLITQVNPFEDVPGYQYARLLAGDSTFDLLLCDDSEVAVDVLTEAGYRLSLLPHPFRAATQFEAHLSHLLASFSPDVIVPGADSHLFAIARLVRDKHPVAIRCLPARWLAARDLFDKWDIQGFISQSLPTPRRWRGTDLEPVKHALQELGRLVVKGLVKEAHTIEDPAQLTVWGSQLISNPANQGLRGGIYFEEFVEGHEYCRLIVKSRRTTHRVDVRKIAATRSGTTMVAEVVKTRMDVLDTTELESAMASGMALEVEWREGPDGPVVFEVNPRFPSWVGALGAYGEMLVRSSVLEQAGRPTLGRAPRPAPGTRIVRLPHSGDFGSSMPQTVGARRPLWDVAAPHQFIVK